MCVCVCLFLSSGQDLLADRAWRRCSALVKKRVAGLQRRKDNGNSALDNGRKFQSNGEEQTPEDNINKLSQSLAHWLVPTTGAIPFHLSF